MPYYLNVTFDLYFQGNMLQCYPECLNHTIYNVYPGITPICDEPSSVQAYSLSPTIVPTCSPSTKAPSLVPTRNNNIFPEERQALQDLYDSTDGPNWYNYYGYTRWDFSYPDTNPCDEGWHGVSCSLDYHITSLYLSYKNLIGTIPSTIDQLSFLQGLYLYSNQLIGTIPTTIGQLSFLQWLDLSYNQLTGTIPSTIGNLSSVQFLNLKYNRLTGIVPASLCQIYLK